MKYLIILISITFVLQASVLNASGLKTYDSNYQTYLKSKIEITYPKTTTVWTAPGKVKLEWTTKNISDKKTIKFYLSKNDMVVQELGIFSNTKFIDNITLDRGLESGDNYRVIGIELFPDDKFNVAKYATPFFTIKKAPRIAKPITLEKSEPAAKRTNFDGRNINYVDELTVASSKIRVSLWDHGRKDGDIVSIYLNGVAIVSKYHLEYQKKVFDISLDTTKPNDLFLYAHNLGKFPPNTVSIEITDGQIAENIVLNSDLKSCEAVLINVSK